MGEEGGRGEGREGREEGREGREGGGESACHGCYFVTIFTLIFHDIILNITFFFQLSMARNDSLSTVEKVRMQTWAPVRGRRSEGVRE